MSQYENQPFALDASWLAEKTGYSRRTVYNAVRFLCGTRLMEVVEARTGRGHHSLYRIRWERRDVSETSVQSHYKEEIRQHRSSEASPQDLSDWESDRRRRTRYLTSGWTTLRKGQYGYKRTAKLFRLSCWDVGLAPSTAETITGMLLNRLEGRSARFIARLHDELFFRIWQQCQKLQQRLQKGIEATCSWIGWLLGQVIRIVERVVENERQENSELSEACDATEQAIHAREHAIRKADRPARLRHAIERFLWWLLMRQDLDDTVPSAAQQAYWIELCAQYSL